MPWLCRRITMEMLWRVRWVFGRMRRNVFLYTSVVLLGTVGVGTCGGVFGLINGVFLANPTHVAAPEELRHVRFRVESARRGVGWAERVSFPQFSRVANAFEDLSVAGRHVAELGWGRGSESRPVRAALVTRDYFRVVGVRPWLGDGELGKGWAAGTSVVLSYRFWQKTFGKAARTVGSVCWINDREYWVAAVLPRGFDGLGPEQIDLWVPLEVEAESVMPPSVRVFEAPRLPWITVWTRVPFGKESEVRARIQALLPDLSRIAEMALTDVELEPLRNVRLRYGNLRRVLYWGLTGSLFLALIVCCNIAHLTLLRNVKRTREIAFQLQLGAQPRHILVDGFLEGLAVGILTLGLSWPLLRHAGGLIRKLGVGKTWNLEPTIDSATAVFVLVVLAIVVFSAGILPAMFALRLDLSRSLYRYRGLAAPTFSRIRAILVTVQIALTWMLVAVLLQFWLTLEHAESRDLGFGVDRVYIVEFPTVVQSELPRIDVMDLYSDVEQRLRSQSGVEGVALVGSLPFDMGLQTSVRLPEEEMEWTVLPYINFVSHDYFEILDIGLVRGAVFRPEPAGGNRWLAVVNQTFARQSYGGEQAALGRCLQVFGLPECVQVMGVVEDTAVDARFQQPPQVYLDIHNAADYGAEHALNFALLVKLGPEGSPGLIYDAANNVPGWGPRYVVVKSLAEHLGPVFELWRGGFRVTFLLALVSLVVSMAALYSYVASWMNMARVQLAVREALGATPMRVLTHAGRSLLGPLSWACLIGLLLSLVVESFTAKLFLRVSLEDKIFSHIAIASAIVIATVVACGHPLWGFIRRPLASYLREE